MKDRRATVLAKYDANKNGKLDFAEKRKLAGDRVDEAFKALDKNRDRKLTMGEITASQKFRYRRLARAFDRIDRDRDSAISRAELDRMFMRRAAMGRRGGKRGKRNKRDQRWGDM